MSRTPWPLLRSGRRSISRINSRWLFFGAGCVEPAIVDRLFSRPPPSRPAALGYGNYDDTLGTLEKVISAGPFILGERFSAADVFVGSAIGWGFAMKAIEPRSAFLEYLKRVSGRPAYQRANAQNEELAKAAKGTN